MQPDFEHGGISKKNEAQLGQLTTRDSPVLFCGLVGAYMATPLQTVNQYYTAAITSSSAS